MAVMSAEEAITARTRARSDPLAPAREASQNALFSLIALAAFALYWLTAVALQARGGTTHFGADAHLYSRLVDGNIDDRITRFHPLTTAMTVVWMKAFGPLLPWISAQNLLKGMFAAAGAAGVFAALLAFAAAVPRRYVVLLGAIYATSLGVWYFSSIEEVEDHLHDAGCVLHCRLSASAHALDSARGPAPDGDPVRCLHERGHCGLSGRHSDCRHAGSARMGRPPAGPLDLLACPHRTA